MKVALVGLVVVVLATSVVARVGSVSNSEKKLADASFSRSNSHREAAKMLLRASNADSILKATYAKLEAGLANQVLSLKSSSKTKPLIDQYVVDIKLAMEEEITWNKLEPPLIDAYVSLYDEKTIKQMTKFYQSDAGKEMLRNQPKMVENTMNIVKMMTENLIPRLKALGTALTKKLEQAEKESLQEVNTEEQAKSEK